MRRGEFGSDGVERRADTGGILELKGSRFRVGFDRFRETMSESWYIVQFLQYIDEVGEGFRAEILQTNLDEIETNRGSCVRSRPTRVRLGDAALNDGRRSGLRFVFVAAKQQRGDVDVLRKRVK